MPDEISDIEMQKRSNYFDLGRDDWMSMDEYLLSGLSNKDLGRAEGGLASLPGYNGGGMLLKDRLAKIDKNIASVRTKPNLFFDLVKQAGFVKKDGSADIKRFNKAAAKVGIDTKDRSASNMNRITKFLNKASTGAYKNVGMFSGKSGLENFASRIKGLIGYYAEKNSAFAKKEFWDDAKKLQRKVNKLKISSAEKVKEVARGLKLKWAVPIGTTTTLLTKIGFGKALPVVGHLITTEMGSGELPKEGTQEYEELMQGLNEEDEKGLEVTVPLPTQEKETVPTERFKGGGMADIYDMTQPLGYNNGGEVETIPSKHQFSPDDINTIKNMLKSEMLRQNSSDINTDKIAYQFMAEMGYKATEKNLKGIRDAITMGMSNAQDELNRENTSDLGKLAGTARDKYQTFMESDDKMRLIGNKLGLGSLWP